MESQRVVVVVEEADASRTAIQWAVRNFFRGGDSITLLYVCPHARSRKKQRSLRLKGFQLALSFKDLCNGIAEAKVEIIVMEGDQGAAISSLVNRIGASTLVVGLHERSFLCRATGPVMRTNNFKCRILAIRQHPKTLEGFINMDFSQVEITTLSMSKAKSSISFCPLSIRTLWRRSKRRKRQTAG